jgi:hypothetical protein
MVVHGMASHGKPGISSLKKAGSIHTHFINLGGHKSRWTSGKEDVSETLHSL